MVTFNTALLIKSWMAIMWPFLRILSMLAADPILGNTAIPARVKIGLAGFLSILLAPILPTPPYIDPGSPEGLLLMAQQVFIGLAMGLAVRILFVALEMAGNLIGLQMGLGFATFFDPQNGTQVPVVAQFIELVGILLFLSVNGHYLVLEALSQSFNVWPVGPGQFHVGGIKALLGWASVMFSIGLKIAMPAIAALLVANIAIGVVSKAAPQLNLFAIGFPITLAIGFVVLGLVLPYLFPLLHPLFDEVAGIMLTIVHLTASG
ncbi:MAG TPA: flagellar biosynthetic protein FliR [Burkholderiales bacterium]|nr:flagellar biosynthetic protein FliR [Pseudomonadota bacterium]HVC49368.1 flagellar biosynthetic protein FliR [Burkholderiales bacterium]